ncbi:DUF2945 domain-containing protein [cf. Phormidesmis sp. LEGE 11477]|uniref:DUF2945 domain-containing protein n=1 Tax=cf. Phormidesmis sp. LEGE 11477 TaxID=1828680 RepID=UPI0018826185|nr:DUF2945 domain-containing protein [cf. Phormidesmis sp. LEGE 11477]MBE9063491.1 DUF2945 domain-containing protein [cf. Phormidesmis sp. LEGE 11477]
MAGKQKFHQGDRVQWSSGQGTSTGTIQKHITEDQTVDDSQISASKDDPRYLVENDNTGTVTGHRPDTLSKADSSSSGSSSSSNSSSSSGSSSSSSSSSRSSSSGAAQFKKGDRVQWNTSQGKTTGTVQKKLTEPTDIEGHTAKASKEEPQYLVKSESTGAEAAHKPEALEKVS